MNLFFSQSEDSKVLFLDNALYVSKYSDEEIVLVANTAEASEIYLSYDTELLRDKDFDRLVHQLKGEVYRG